MARLSPPWPTSGNGISANYDLHCHCGAVKYSMELSPPLYLEHAQGKERWTAVECDCSHCDRVGAINVHPQTKYFTITKGKEHIVEYRSAGKQNPHYNCGKCGCFLYTDLAETMKKMEGPEAEGRLAVNVSIPMCFESRSGLCAKY
jgi:hypothetical protein